MRKLKLIWDFRGSVASKIAEHHEIHLIEYITNHSISVVKTGTEIINELHCIAFMVIEESDLKPIKDSLKPHRAQVYNLA